MAWQAFLLFSISAGVVPPLPPSSNVRSDDRHHRRRHISCVICAQSVLLLLRLQKERGMGQTAVGGREKSRFCLSACLSVALLTIRDLQPRWPKGDRRDSRTVRRTDGRISSSSNRSRFGVSRLLGEQAGQWVRNSGPPPLRLHRTHGPRGHGMHGPMARWHLIACRRAW